MTDIDRALRDMLRERAQDITTVPSRLLAVGGDEPAGAANDRDTHASGDAEILDLGSWRSEPRAALRRRWPLLLAVAAVLVIVAGVLATLSVAPHRAQVPGHRGHRVETVTRAACRTGIPRSWDAPVRAATFSPDGSDASVAAVTDDGGTVTVFDTTGEPAGEQGQHVGYLAPGSNSMRDLGFFGVVAGKRKSSGFGLDIDVSGPIVVVSVESGLPVLAVREIVAVDIATGRRTVIARISSYENSTISSQGYVQDGVVYWQTTLAGNHLRQRVWARSIDGGPASVVSTGHSQSIVKSALGIQWNENGGPVDRPVPVPGPVSRSVLGGYAVAEVFDSYVTDGSAWAWRTESGALDWYSPTAGHVITVPGVLGRPGSNQAFVNGVAGPLVYYQDRSGNGHRVLDTRTGADMPVRAGGLVLGAHGTAIGDSLLLPPSDTNPPSGVMRVDTADLPAATC